MADPIKRALARRRLERGHFVIEEPDDFLVYSFKFCLGITCCLTAIEIANLAFLHAWNSEVFAALSGFSGMLMGVFVGRKT